MQAVITAGGKPQPKDPLYNYTQGSYKALLKIAGKPMIQWEIDALNAARCVDHIVIIGLPLLSQFESDIPITLLPDAGGLVSNTRAGLQAVLDTDPTAIHAMMLSSDVPALTSDMLLWLAEKGAEGDHDVLYPVIERTVMEKRYPASRRTYVHLKDAELCGGDVLILSTRLAHDENPIWEKLTATRKNPIQQAGLLGFDTLFMILLRQLTLEKAAEMIGKRLGVSIRGVITPFAELGMDVDKPHQFDMVRADLDRQRTP